MNKLLSYAISNNQVKEYYGNSYLIYPKRFLNSFTFDVLLSSLKNEYNFYNIMGTIKAMPKTGGITE